MTKSTIASTELAAKGGDVDFIKQTLEFALQRLMDMNVETRNHRFTLTGDSLRAGRPNSDKKEKNMPPS